MANVSIDVAGQLRPDTISRDVIPVTEFGPVLDGSVLEGLPGPCVPVPQPGENTAQVVTGCFNAPSVRNLRYFNSKTQIAVSEEVGQRTHFVGYETVKIAGQEPVRVFFDFNNLNNEFYGAGVVIVQSDTAFPEDATATSITEWFDRPGTRKLRDTRSNGFEATSDGQQVGKFGFDAWSSSQQLGYGAVQRLLGVDDLQSNNYFAVGSQITEPPLLDFPVAQLPIYSQNADLRCRGYGFIQASADCRRGEYLTVFVVSDINIISMFATSDPILWQAVIDYNTEAAGLGDGSQACTDEILNAPSRAYQQGAIVNEWVGQNTYGYFGQVQNFGETAPNEEDDSNFIPVQPQDRYLDNIYYPYELPDPNLYLAPGGLTPGYNQDPLRSAPTAPGITQLAPRYISGINGVFNFGGPYRTVEIKGYFRAPVSGEYQFSGSAQDGLWMWLSSQGVSNKQRVGVSDEEAEYFKEDGFDPGNNRNYGRQNYVLRVGALTANTEGRTESNGISVTLEQGKYYFVRILSGCNERSGFFSIFYEATAQDSNNTTVGNLVFTGKACAEDRPPINSSPGGGGGFGGGGALPGPGGFDGLYRNFEYNSYIFSSIVDDPFRSWMFSNNLSFGNLRRGTVTIRDLPDSN